MTINTQRLAWQLGQRDLTLPAHVQKRDGSTVSFDIRRIEKAVAGCWSDFDTPPATPVEDVVTAVSRAIASRYGEGDAPTVEQIQDLVEVSLLNLGEVEAARAYMAYRDVRAKERNLVPADIKAVFDQSAAFFPTPIQQFQYFDKYARFNWDQMHRETWVQTVDRVVDYLRWLVDEHSTGSLPDKVFARIRSFILEQKAMPSMRALAMAGEPAKRNSLAIYNCLAADEKYLTPEGLKSFGDTVGTTQMVLNGSGKWTEAEIKEFGVQRLQEVTFRPGYNGRSLVRHHIKVTPDHRWITRNRGVVTDLRVGDCVDFVGSSDSGEFHHDAWIAGFGYGDGTIDAQGLAKVRLCGEKDAQWVSSFEQFGHNSICYPPSYNGDAVVIFHKGYFADWKQLPSMDKGADWLRCWLEGYLAADGHVGVQPGLSSQSTEAIEFVKKIAPLCGYMVTGHNTSSVMETNLGTRKAALQRLTLRKDGFFSVTNIEDLNVDETVYCAVVPDGHDFTLANGIRTGNCSYMPVKDPNVFVEALLISMAGCGVGFSVERQYVEQFPRVARQVGVPAHPFVVPDSTDGWAEALRFGLDCWFSGLDVEYDFSLVRKAGTPLLIKGGRASGPEPLKTMLTFVRETILKRQGSFLRTIDAHDMMCAVGQAAVAGGVRRTAMISLFSWDDHEMRDCKNGAWGTWPAIRENANNSAVWPDGLSQVEVVDQMMEMVRGKRGEPGIFSRENANRTKPARREEAEFGTNPCGEINLRPFGLCNLSIAVARPDDTYDDLRDKVEVASIIGTIQSLATEFPGMRAEWKDNCVQERLLGVDITGQRDCHILNGADAVPVRDDLAEHAIFTNQVYADLLEINHSASVTCDKPSGNSSQLLNTSSGIHARWSPYYLRRTRVSATSALYRVLRAAGVPLTPENGQTESNATTWVVAWPMRAPEGVKTRKDFTAVDQCNYWLLNKQHWTEHNPSVTITYQPDEVLSMIQWVWDHRDMIGGMAFLPADDAAYEQAPYEEIDQATYERLAAEFPAIDFSLLYAYEHSDMTSAAQEAACLSGLCDA